jgi:hypothetical protein
MFRCNYFEMVVVDYLIIIMLRQHVYLEKSVKVYHIMRVDELIKKGRVWFFIQYNIAK